MSLRMFPNLSLTSDGGSAKDAIYSIMIFCGDAGIVRGQYAVYAVLNDPEDAVSALTVGPFISLQREKRMRKVVRTDGCRCKQLSLMRMQ